MTTERKSGFLGWDHHCRTRGRKKSEAAQRRRKWDTPTKKTKHMPATLHGFVQGNSSQHTLNCLLVCHLGNTASAVTKDHNHCCAGNELAILAALDARGNLHTNSERCHFHCFALGETGVSHMVCALFVFAKASSLLHVLLLLAGIIILSSVCFS